MTSAGVLTKATTDDPLTDGIVYDVYVIAEDDAADDARTHKPGLTASDNLQAAPTKVQVTTADGTAPLFSGNPCDSKKHEVCTSILHSETYQHSKYPLMTDCAADKFTLTVNVDEPGSTVYYVVVADATDYSTASAAPTTDPTLEQVSSFFSFDFLFILVWAIRLTACFVHRSKTESTTRTYGTAHP